MMEAAGIDPGRIRLVSDAPVRVGKLYWPTRNRFGPLNTSPHAIKALRDLSDRLIPVLPRTGRRIFLSRRDATTRQLLNDVEVYARLEPLGFEWVEPGRMRFLDQMSTFKSSSKVVAVCGAALTNMVFLPPGSEVVMLTPQTAAGFWFWDLSHHVGARFTVVFGRNNDRSVKDKSADFRIRPEDVRVA
jgi:capsular polysaccharide biosynthesis protein